MWIPCILVGGLAALIMTLIAYHIMDRDLDRRRTLRDIQRVIKKHKEKFVNELTEQPYMYRPQEIPLFTYQYQQNPNQTYTNPNPNYTNPTYTNQYYSNPNYTNQNYTNSTTQDNPNYTNQTYTNQNYTNSNYTNSTQDNQTYTNQDYSNTSTQATSQDFNQASEQTNSTQGFSSSFETETNSFQEAKHEMPDIDFSTKEDSSYQKFSYTDPKEVINNDTISIADVHTENTSEENDVYNPYESYKESEVEEVVQEEKSQAYNPYEAYQNEYNDEIEEVIAEEIDNDAAQNIFVDDFDDASNLNFNNNKNNYNTRFDQRQNYANYYDQPEIIVETNESERKTYDMTFRIVPKVDYKHKEVININVIGKYFEEDERVTLEKLKQIGLLPKKTTFLKILASGSLNKRLTIEAHDFSLDAIRNIKQAGGTVVKVIENPTVEDNPTLAKEAKANTSDSLRDDKKTYDMTFRIVPKVDYKHKEVININVIGKYFEDGERVTLEKLKQIGLLPKKTTYLKVLASGSLNKRLTIEAHDFSLDAIKIIRSSNGSIIKLIEN